MSEAFVRNDSRALQAGGRRFDPGHVHQPSACNFNQLLIWPSSDFPKLGSLTGQTSGKCLLASLVLPALDFLLAWLSFEIAFPPLLRSSFLPPRLLCLFLFSPACWRRNVCFREGGVLSVVVGFIPIPVSKNGKRRVVGLSVARSRSGNPTSNGESTGLLQRCLSAAKSKIRNAR
jgi:hypothetical protein